MASAAPTQGLPLLYKELMPLSSSEHGGWKQKGMDSIDFLKEVHAIPVTVDEFAAVQRFYPIVFSVGDQPVPLALMGLNEGVNTFIGEDGNWQPNTYVPAYIRRYPFLLARLREGVDELSLCFDPSADTLGDYPEGEAMFENGEPTQRTKDILQFCEQFEIAGQRTAAFVKEVQDHGLLMEGEVSIQPEGAAQPFVYRGFQMINEEKVRELRGDQLRKMMQSGLLPLVFAHLYSLAVIQDIFGKQMALGKVPTQQ